MAHSNLGRRLIEKIEAKIYSYESDLGSGAAKDYAGYQFVVGIIGGLKDALAELNELEREE